MSDPELGTEPSEQRRAVTIRSIILGALMCVVMACAISYFDVIKGTSELGGCHFPPAPIFLFVLLVLVLNLPVKAMGVMGNVISGGIVGFGGALLWTHYHGDPGWLLKGLLWGGVAAIGLSIILALLIGRRSLNARELILIFSMMLISSGITSFGFIGTVLPMMNGWQYLATPDAVWVDAFQYIPDWMVVGDPVEMLKAVNRNLDFEQVGQAHFLTTKWFYEGIPEGQSIPWRPWVKPVLAWSLFAALLYGLMFCLVSILRKQWVEREKLLFPLMQLPVEMAKSEEEPGVISPLLKNRFLIAGFLVPFLVHSATQLKHYYVSPVGYNQNPLRQRLNPFAGTALEPFGSVWPLVFFSVFGFCYLLSTEISLSVWLFWVINRFQRLVLDWIGTPGIMDQPNTPGAAQFNGALIVFVLFGLYAARRHLWDVFRKAVFGDKSVDDSGELIGYRASFFGLIITLTGLVAWCGFMGMKVWVAWFVFFFFVITIIGITRAVAECGLLIVKIESAQPQNYIRALLGTRFIDPVSFTVLGFVRYVSMFDLKTLFMPALMQGCKGRDTVGDRSKKTLVAFVLAVVIVILVSGTLTVRACYSGGASNAYNWFYTAGPTGHGLTPMMQWINERRGPDYTAVAYMIGGAAVSGFLIFMRRGFAWWPLHPLGYIMSQGYFESTRVAFSFFIGWMVKVAVLKFGGGGLFKRLRPFFLGLILGEFGTAGIWIVFGFIKGEYGPWVFPG